MLKKKNTKQFIKDVISVHGNTYDYTLTKYIKCMDKVKIICKDHGVFLQRADNHLQGQGCPSCKHEYVSSNNKKPQNHFIQESIKKHNNLYCYSKVVYNGTHKKVKIICKDHGVFLQSPSNHIRGSGCPKCSCSISKSEKEWLKFIGLPDTIEYRQVWLIMNNGKKKLVDGYDPRINTVYEFNGDFWHGNPDTTNHSKINPVNKKTFGELYDNTLIKETLIKDSGYNIVTMWENEWNNNKFMNGLL